MKKNILNYYKLVSYRRLADYLLLKDDIDEELIRFKDIILTEEFIDVLRFLLNNINHLNMSYPMNSYLNATKLLTYIKKNTNYKLDELVDSVYNITDFSNEKYNYEYIIKQLSLNLEMNKNIVIWNKKNIEESMLYDYIVTKSLNSSDDDFLSKYLPNFIFNKNVIFSINKIIKENKLLLEDKKIKKRLRTIVNTNLNIISKSDMEDISSLYIEQNYNKYNDNFNTQEIEIFKELNQNIVNMLNNPEINVFNIESIKEYFDYLKIDHFIYSDDSKIDNSILLDNIYFYIDNVVAITLPAKNKLIKLLESYKNIATDKEKYNCYINEANSLNPSEDVTYEFKTRSSIFTYIKASVLKMQGNDSLYKNVLSSRMQDLYNFELLILDDEFFDKNVMYINLNSFQYSLKKFMDEYPSMFLSEQVLSRSLTIIDKYKNLDVSNIKKKLEKIKKA